MNLKALRDLSSGELRALAADLRAGKQSHGPMRSVLRHLVGAEHATPVEESLNALALQGFKPAQMAVVLDALADSRCPEPTDLFSFVLSGPEARGVDTKDTAAVTLTLIAEATREVVLVGYAAHDGKRVFKPLADRFTALPDLKVVMYFNIQRECHDPRPDADVVREFARRFRKQHWPWERLPELYYDSRALSLDLTERACLHAKCVIVDRRVALVTSANFTEAAQHRNIEAGVLVQYQPFVERLFDHFAQLTREGRLVPCPLPDSTT